MPYIVRSLELSQTPPRRPPMSDNQYGFDSNNITSVQYKDMLVIQHYAQVANNILKFFYRCLKI